MTRYYKYKRTHNRPMNDRDAEDGVRGAKVFKESSQSRLNGKNMTDIVCLRCRQTGHRLQQCPQHGPQGGGSSPQGLSGNVCYRCGSQEHSLSACSEKTDDSQPSLPFAECFVCSAKGHLSAQCPQNPRGVYPQGGNCRKCGSVGHLVRDCPQQAASKDPSNRADQRALKQRRQAVKKIIFK